MGIDMTLESYITFIIQSIIITALPGPTMLLLIHYSMQYGKWAGRFSVPGVVIGDIFALVLTFMGLGAVLEVSPNLLYTLKIIGGTYLITLGVTEIKSRASIPEEREAFPKPPGRRLFTHMLIITTFNPQNLVFLLAFFPQFISPSDGYLHQFLIMGIGYVFVGGAFAVIFNLAAHKISTSIEKPSIKKYIHLTSGAFLCIIGILIIFS
jgi:threonine/homoserine/homoserine lactone efflux protein